MYQGVLSEQMGVIIVCDVAFDLAAEPITASGLRRGYNMVKTQRRWIQVLRSPVAVLREKGGPNLQTILVAGRHNQT